MSYICEYQMQHYRSIVTSYLMSLGGGLSQKPAQFTIQLRSLYLTPCIGSSKISCIYFTITILTYEARNELALSCTVKTPTPNTSTDRPLPYMDWLFS